MKVAKNIAIVMILVGILFIGLYFVGKSAFQDSSVVSNNSLSGLIGKTVPYFDLPNTLTGRIKSSDFFDTPTIVFFWASWDTNSLDQLKIFDDYLLSQKDSGNLIKVVGIDSQEDKSIAKSLISRGGYSLPIAVDGNGSVSEEFGVKGLPTIFFIDKNGVVKGVWSGVLSEAQIVDKSEDILR